MMKNRSDQVGQESVEQELNKDEEKVTPGDSGTEENVSKTAENEAADANVQEGDDLAALKQELAETKDRMLRIAADAENFKKRMERDKERMLKYAGENILRELLTTADNLERALEQGRTGSGDAQKKLDAMLEGVELTSKGLLSVLEKFEVTPIESVGREFNPDEMDALTMENSEEVPANHVVQEFAKGYRFKDRVLRHAQVIVSSGKSA